MKARNRKLWAEARTLDDLGELTARWLQGDIEHPGYDGDPDEETMPHTEILAGINRLGFVTISSQPGYDGPGFDGAHWIQFAAVHGFASGVLVDRLRAAAEEADLLFICHPANKRRRCTYGGAVGVSFREQESTCTFGARFSRRFIAEELFFNACSGEAEAALGDAMQITIVDYDEGPNDELWELLDALVKHGSLTG